MKEFIDKLKVELKNIPALYRFKTLIDRKIDEFVKKESMPLEFKIEEWIEEILSKLSFVKWDRFVEDKKDNLIEMYGWIDREKDSYKDFVLLEFNLSKKEVYFIATSSDKYSKEIAEILNSSHSDCIRVEERFNIINATQLKGGKKEPCQSKIQP